MTSIEPSNINPALAALKDIQLPQPTSFWPLAPGYWIAFFIILFLLIFLFIWIHRKHRITKAKVAALTALDNFSVTDKDFSQQINILLKRAVLSYLPRHEVAALDGENWYQLLDSQLPNNKKGKFKLLLDKRFSETSLSLEEATELKNLTQYWLKKALPLDLANTQVQEAIC